MPTVVTSRYLCINCNKHHLNAHPDSIPTLMSLGMSTADIKHLLTQGDQAAALHNQPTKHRQVTEADEIRLKTMGMSDIDIATLRGNAERLAAEDIDPDLLQYGAVELERVPGEPPAPVDPEVKAAHQRAVNAARQKRWYERNRGKSS